MWIGELAQRAGVTTKAVRYYERLGLLAPGRGANNYRDYDESDLQAVMEVRELSANGIAPSRARPFVDCLMDGHEHGDDCVTSLVAYRDAIAELDQTIASLSIRRARLVDRLNTSASRSFTQESPPMADFTSLPANLPVPVDDGAAEHLPGRTLPELTLPTSKGGTVDLAALGAGRTVIYLYPLTGRPGADLPAGWDTIPGARGCSAEACDFRDHLQDLHDAGATNVYGLSSQPPEYQAEVTARLDLPFAMISDESFRLADALTLPTFSPEGHGRLYTRLTLITRDGHIEHAFYPIFPPNTHAQQVLGWLQRHPVSSATGH